MHIDNAKTILIVDDDANLTKALAVRFGNKGYHCVTAESARQGAAAFSHGRIDLVITDLSMPGGDGVELAESMRRDAPVPLIVITGFKDEYKRRLRGVEDVTVIRKPFETRELIELVDATLERENAV